MDVVVVSQRKGGSAGSPNSFKEECNLQRPKSIPNINEITPGANLANEQQIEVAIFAHNSREAVVMLGLHNRKREGMGCAGMYLNIKRSSTSKQKRTKERNSYPAPDFFDVASCIHPYASTIGSLHLNLLLTSFKLLLEVETGQSM
ncbi:hypothetical protein L2E82_05668 [Cichorium intybus]|uniref:Uncharacterized protein n=1 Tax=Cichorium intybus TaxID=13427 RepID=A0ACB9H7U3_CICIN|nr:hypothetical protein L2E82_05668 [Cichorium intybus]